MVEVDYSIVSNRSNTGAPVSYVLPYYKIQYLYKS